MRYLSVCSGIEAATVAWHALGWVPIGFAEIDPYACHLLRYYYPHVPNYGDMETLALRILRGEIEAPDVLVGGTPCQGFSVAGLRLGLADTRGNLTLRFVELINAIDHARLRAGKPPVIVVWENVPGVLSMEDNAFGCFLGGLAGEDGELQPPGEKWANVGAVYGPARSIAWRILDAQYFELAQRRTRVFVVASARDGFDPAEVLFEWQGVRRDLAPRRESAKDVAAALTASAGHHGRSSPRGDGSDNLVAGTLAGGGRANGGYSYDDVPLVAGALQANGKAAGSATQQDSEAGLLVAGTLRGHPRPGSNTIGAVTLAYGGNNTSGPIDVATARSASASASASASGRLDFESETFVVHGTQDPCVGEDVAFTLGRNTGQENAVAIAFQSRGKDRVDVQEDLSYALLASGSNGGRRHEMNIAAPVAFAENSRSELRLQGGDGAIVGPLNCGGGKPGQGLPAVFAGLAVRRLTPLECERLQGFPDDYTLIPIRTSRLRCVSTTAQRRRGIYRYRYVERTEFADDGPRYRALGNSMPVPVMRWIGQRIAIAVADEPAHERAA